LAIGNALVGNPPDSAALEICLTGPTLEGDCDLACVVYGAPFELASDRQSLQAGTTFTLRSGERLHIGGTPRRARAYLCVQGGLQVPLILGSRNSLGPLQVGTVLPCTPGTIRPRFVRIEPVEGPGKHAGEAGDHSEVIRVLDAAQTDWFRTGDFYGEEDSLPRIFTVTPASNRMGLRLKGGPLRFAEHEMVSEPVCPGTVQVTRDGQCIVLGVDGQTIGGYPKIAQVIGADLDRLGQLRPGDRIRFVRVSLEEAEVVYRRRRAQLREWVLRLRTAEFYP
jgi:biotin-dependent carboxylase-like uncharacterized protein